MNFQEFIIKMNTEWEKKIKEIKEGGFSMISALIEEEFENILDDSAIKEQIEYILFEII